MDCFSDCGFYLANGWNNNGTLGGIYELYGATVPWSALSWYYQGMGYDNLNRLTSIADSSGTVSNYSRTFQYDEYGNMSLATTPGVPLSGLTPMAGTGAYNAANNRLNSSGYDTRGNMTHLGAVWMAYDAESRQTQTVDSGQTLIYLYDAAGQRVQKQIAGGATTVYVHDAFGNLAAEYNSAGVTPACATCYLSYDHLGSVRLVTDQNANVVARHDFLPFGEEIPNGYAGRNGNGFGATGNVAQMFTGQERDGGTAVMDYFNARHMSAVLGSFMQADPGNAAGDVMHPQSWNAYAYVLGNPLGMVDPSGRNCVNLDNGSTGDDGQGTPCPGSQDPDVLTIYSNGTGVALSFGGNYGNGYPGGGGQTQNPTPSPAKTGTVNLQDAKARCVNGLILGGITTGFSDFLGIGPDPDPTGDFTQPARDALKNPVVRVAAGVTVSNVVRRIATRQVALRAAAAVGEDVIPVAGQLVLAYQVGHAVYSGLDYYISGINSGACENPHE